MLVLPAMPDWACFVGAVSGIMSAIMVSLDIAKDTVQALESTLNGVIATHAPPLSTYGRILSNPHWNSACTSKVVSSVRLAALTRMAEYIVNPSGAPGTFDAFSTDTDFVRSAGCVLTSSSGAIAMLRLTLLMFSLVVDGVVWSLPAGMPLGQARRVTLCRMGR